MLVISCSQGSESLNNASNAANLTVEEAEAKHFLSEITPRLETLNSAQVEATWKFNTDINTVNEAKLVSVTTYQLFPLNTSTATKNNVSILY